MVGNDFAVGVLEGDARALFKAGDGGVFVQRHVAGQALRQAFGQGGRLQQLGAGRVQRLAVERRAEVCRQVTGIDHLVGLAEFFQAAAVGLQHGQALVFDGGLVLAVRA
ncbi:hypothetical protein D3C80_1564100 [compost metagenome]